MGLLKQNGMPGLQRYPLNLNLISNVVFFQQKYFQIVFLSCTIHCRDKLVYIIYFKSEYDLTITIVNQTCHSINEGSHDIVRLFVFSLIQLFYIFGIARNLLNNCNSGLGGGPYWSLLKISFPCFPDHTGYNTSVRI